MADMDSLRDKILYTMTQSEKAVKHAMQSKSFVKLFKSDEVSLRIVKEFLKWYQDYKELPSARKISANVISEPQGPRIQLRLSQIESMHSDSDKPLANEFAAIVDDLKMQWMKTEMNEKMINFSVEGIEKITDIANLSRELKEFGNKLVKISDEVIMQQDGDYSFTTHNIDENIKKIIDKDTINEKRFKIGHRIFDNASGGLRYGDLMMVLGNINAGKSMVLTNMVYNLWRGGANVLLLTAEMQPGEFDERIYSRATAINYSDIINGRLKEGGIVREEEQRALDAYSAEVKSKKNQIVTKFLRASDNVSSVENYIEDLKLKFDFIPDVILVDSLEHISARDTSTEDKDNLKVAQIITEFKDFAQTCFQNRGVVVISTHQAKTDTFDKELADVAIVDFGRSKVAAEKPDFALYIRSKLDTAEMFVKLIKARRTTAGISWKMAIDFSKCMIQDANDAEQSVIVSE
jgi:archaellum biogenesis ATPase FlaH